MKKLFTLAISLVLFVSFGCSKSNDMQQKSGITTKKITIAQYGHVFLYIPLYVAKNNGFFKDEGLDVDLVSTGGDEKTFAAVASGSAQFGIADPTFTAIAREKGQGGKVIGSIVNGVPFWGVTFNKNMKQINRPEALAGLRIATYTAPSTNYTVMKKVLQNDKTPIKAKIVEGSFGSLIAMLKAGKADVAMELEPVASISVAEGAQVVYSLSNVFGDFAFTGITTTDAYLKEKPEIVQAAVKAISRAIKFIRTDFEGTLLIAKKEFPEVEEKILRLALKRMIDENTVPQTVVLSKEAWEHAINLRKDVGDIKGAALYEENVDMSFASKLN